MLPSSSDGISIRSPIDFKDELESEVGHNDEKQDISCPVLKS